MRMGALLRWVLLLAVIGLAGVAIYMRVVPVTASLWHVPSDPSGIGHISTPNGHTWRGTQTADGTRDMARFDAIIRQTPRTQAIAGSVQEGMITYITRSRWWQFPDFTTLERNVDLVEGGAPVISVHSRAQFGASDLGVNQRRLREWLLAFRAGG
jgi:hypothetical protein